MFFLFSIDFFLYQHQNISFNCLFFFLCLNFFFKCRTINFAYKIESEEMCVRSHIGLTTTS